MIAPISAELTSVFVPVQGIDAIKDPDAAYAGMTEVIREKFLSGNPLFGLENESEISKHCGVNPRSVNGVKKVNEMVRLAHNAAINYLRQRKYVKATKTLANNMVISPAMIGQTVLERLNGVLDPDGRINGMIPLELPDVKLPVGGLGIGNGNAAPNPEVNSVATTVWADGNRPVRARRGQDVAFGMSNGLPDVFAQLNGVEAGGVSLTDFYNAQEMDRLVRTMRSIVDANPEYGKEMVLRWAHGLSVDSGHIPFVISHQTQNFGRTIVPAIDTAGVQDDVMRSDMMLQLNFTVPIPRTEMGGIIITFAVLKPDETLSAQPHPYLSDVWGPDNYVADELALDPVPVTIRELDSDCTAA